jgi:flagellum-specific ATP synthase
MLRATLDGHVVLARRLAQQGHYPAIDLLHSASRLLGDLAGADELALVHDTLELLSTYERNRQLIEMGAYKAGSSAAIDAAISLWPALTRFLRQRGTRGNSRAEALADLRTALRSPATQGAAA